MTIKFSILEKDGVEFSTPTEMDGTMALMKAGVPFASYRATSTTTTTSNADTPIIGALVTLTPGRHLVFCYGSFEHGSNNGQVIISLFKAGVKIPDTGQVVARGGNQFSGIRFPWGCMLDVFVSGPSDEVVQMYWRTPSGTATSRSRFIVAVKVKDET